MALDAVEKLRFTGLASNAGRLPFESKSRPKLASAQT